MKFCIAAVLSACALVSISAEAGTSLTREQAQDRSARLSNIRYQLQIKLGFEDEYSGSEGIEFDLSKASELRLDFGGGTVKQLNINGMPAPILHVQGALALPGALLREGKNRVELSYSHPYSETGDGLYRFKDPADGNLYLYSNFEPYAANQLFPCFDQPDLKAVYELTVDAPREWTVISASQAETQDAGTDRRVWKFAKTAPFSTYVMSLHAGPYASWESSAGKTRLRLFARKSLAQFVDHEEWFRITKQGFSFYEDYFGIPYAFGKYDQIFVPEFNWGGMENVAAVAFNERYIHRSKLTRTAKLQRADIILHELAHLWFGDLVTMKWWDDLWLNESFASYMAALAMEHAGFSEAWQFFNWRMKRWAMNEDRLPTTHPIRTPIPDTASAHANFDGITYGKGASALKQLAFLAGENAFRDGIRKYLKKHSFSNATLVDFMRAMEESSRQDLQGWQAEWLNRPGLSGLHARPVCQGARLTSVVLEQSPVSGSGTIRHAANLTLVDKTSSREMRVIYAGKTTTVPASGSCPSLVFPNAGDHDYARVVFDDASLSAVRSFALDQGVDALSRLIVWQSLWDRVREGRMGLQSYASLLLSGIENEKNSYVLSLQLEILAARDERAASLLSYLSDSRFRERADETVWKRLLAAPAGSEDQILLFDAFARTASTAGGLKHLRGVLQGEVSGLTLDRDRRWAAILRLNIWTADAAGLIDAEELSDRSDEGRKMAAQCRLARPDAKSKAAFLDQVEAGTLSDAMIKRLLPVLFPYGQRELQRSFDTRMFDLITTLSGQRDHHFMKALTLWAPPVSCNAAGSTRLESYLKSHSNLPVIVQKNLKAALDEDRICTGLVP